MSNETTVERTSEREFVVRRAFAAPAAVVFAAWTTPELLKKWWVPRSMGVSLVSCEADVRPGGSYRFAIGPDGGEPMLFFGTYLEAVPDARLVWTNEESEDDPVTTVTFEAADGSTLVITHERHPNAESLEESLAGSGSCAAETHAQLDALLPELIGRG